MEEELESLLDGEAVRVHAGFPNPAADRRGQHRALTLDFNQLLVQHPSSTYLFRISGNSWTEQGILNGDVAVIDRALHPRQTDLIIAWQNDSFIIYLYKDLPEGQEYWGVITSVVHTLRGRE
jgi:SOS-response transcriptional repressor LexA